MKPTRLVLVGGFLGAGKTTLLSQVVRGLVRQGKRVGLITNDQAPDLVDTGMLRQAGLSVEEIAGGCFCCRFSDLITASNRLVDEINADVLIGEPVGSCTDISATVLQPLKELFPDRFHLAHFSVLVDPFRFAEVLDPRMKSSLHPSARYILRKQIEEADIVVINKIDLLPAEELAELLAQARERFPDVRQSGLSALTGEGVPEWLDLILHDGPAGSRITDVDYDVYAEGEAVLGWLNATVSLSSREQVDWKTYCIRLLETLRHDFQRKEAEIAHVKLLLVAPDGQLAANLTRTDDSVTVRGGVNGAPREVKLIANARVQMPPRELKTAVETAFRSAGGSRISVEIINMNCLSPGRPKPTHRYTAIV